jgi:hypothetical protein
VITDDDRVRLDRLLEDLQETLAQSQRAVRLMTTALLLMVFTVMLNLIALLI